MKILEAEFIKSASALEQLPQDRAPEVAIVGRSNVGKSSLINSILRRRAIAKVSSTPGKTRLLNVIAVRTDAPELRRLYLVDLPGYGYAKVSKALRSEWGPMIERYLRERDQLRGVLLLVDARQLGAQDRPTIDWLRLIGRSPLVVVTKIDKLARSQRAARLAEVGAHLGFEPGTPLIGYSSVSHEGREEVWQAIRRLVAETPPGGARRSAVGEPDHP